MWRLCLIFTLISLPDSSNCDETFCLKVHGKNRDLIQKNGYLYEKNSTKPVVDHDLVNCLCKFKPCISKCCNHDEVLSFRTCSKSNETLDVRPYLEEGSGYFFLFRTQMVEGILLDPNEDPSFAFQFTDDGNLFLPFELIERNVYDLEEYCVDLITDDNMDYGVKVLLSPRAPEEIVEKIEQGFKRIGMVISMPFLLITFIVYALLPDRNLHMKALMCYVINLLLAYMFIVTIQLSDTVFPDDICAILGFGCIFFFLSSFFWMNVICIDIFLGFRGIRGGPGIRSSEWKRFLIYCIYAWGMSLLIVFITFMINTYVNPISIFHPGVAIGQCFIRDGLPMLLYFYGPMGILIISNVLLFALTALRIRKVKKDTAMLKHSGSKRHSDDEQQNFNLYFKLLLAMGVNWSMEIISWAVTLPQYFWYLSDICNALYGVIIFFIFVFKRNIWKQLKRRYYSFMGRHHMAHSMGTTNFTKTTNDSMTVSTNDRAMEESELNTSRMN
ncbi:G-protein coupled receptor Mth2-like isoform X1 [Harmonia axyridis]|uniref:G-protein coupled receptor Mth2-like isoform X1 n=1 Tax=Harmonia axyridis TaxID=115357 RepID=UPI001E27635E|nr:G-protein coupled receptor Mth2-like isoform X1 [Harmonia axyridis]